MDVMFYEVFEEEEAQLKEYLPQEIKAEFTKNTIQEIGGNEPPANLISIRTQSRVPEEWKSSLKGVLSRSHGYDHLINIQESVNCGYLKDYCAYAVAEHAIMAMLVLLRKLKGQVNHFDTFNRDGLTGSECRGKNALVVGIGCIGVEVANIARSLKMQVRGVDIEPREADVEYVDLKSGLIWADVIFCCLPLTEQTNRMLGYEAFANIRTCPTLINISRGEITPIEDIKRLLDENILKGVSLDVYPNEGEFAGRLRASENIENETHQIILSLSDRDDVLFTPHNAFNTKESTQEKSKRTVISLAQFLKSGKFPHPLPQAG